MKNDEDLIEFAIRGWLGQRMDEYFWPRIARELAKLSQASSEGVSVVVSTNARSFNWYDREPGACSQLGAA